MNTGDDRQCGFNRAVVFLLVMCLLSSASCNGPETRRMKKKMLMDLNTTNPLSSRAPAIQDTDIRVSSA